MPTVAITATDCVGNVSQASLDFFVDGQAPQVTGSVVVDAFNGAATLPLFVTDAVTNIQSVRCLLDFDANGNNPDINADFILGDCPGLSGLPTLPDGSVSRPRTYQGEIQMGELAPGAHALWIDVRDFWGHHAFQRFDFTIARGVGHIIAIGHDYDAPNDDAATVVGNAAARSSSFGYVRPLRVLTLDLGSGDAEANASANVRTAINGRLATLGHLFCDISICADFHAWAGNLSSGDEDLAPHLPGHDVLLIFDQNDPASASRVGAKPAWRAEIEAFARAGGIVIVLDGTVGGVASQTVAILGGEDPASLLATHSEGATAGPVSTGCCASDPLVAGVAGSYAASANTVSFAPVSTANAVLVTPSGDPVVIDRSVAP
jgi:hypothetical protein